MVTRKDSSSAITEERYTRLVVEFANTGQLTGALLRVPGIRLLVPLESFTGKVERNVVVGHVSTEELERLRGRLREGLSAIAQDTIGKEDLRKFGAEASELKIEPTYDFDDTGRLTASYHYFPPGASAAIAYGVMLLADAARPFRGDLKQCRLTTCGRFFFSSDSPAATGRDRARYCTPEHMLEAHRATSAERTRKWRKRKAEATRRPKQRG